MEFFDHTDDEIYALAKPIIQSMNDAANRYDYQTFSAHFSIKMLELVSEEKFTRQMKTHIPENGELGKFTLLGCIRRESGVTIAYRQHTTRKRGELLAQLRLDEEDGEIKVIYSGIQ